jgi:hypothetical protein
VEATDRRWARVKIFQTIIRRLEEALTERGFELPEEVPFPTPEEDEEERELEEAALAQSETAEGPASEEGAESLEEDQDNEDLETELVTEAVARTSEG